MFLQLMEYGSGQAILSKRTSFEFQMYLIPDAFKMHMVVDIHPERQTGNTAEVGYTVALLPKNNAKSPGDLTTHPETLCNC